MPLLLAVSRPSDPSPRRMTRNSPMNSSAAIPPIPSTNRPFHDEITFEYELFLIIIGNDGNANGGGDVVIIIIAVDDVDTCKGAGGGG